MKIFVDGFQNTGKSTLIERSPYKHGRFPFNQYLDMFGLSSKESLNGFQIAKDLGMLFALRFAKGNIVFDRGPLSTAFYSLKESRFGQATRQIVEKFLEEVSAFEDCGFVFVKKKGGEGWERKRNDGFDYLDDESDRMKEAVLGEALAACEKAGIDAKVFENDFSASPEENSARFNALLKEMIG